MDMKPKIANKSKPKTKTAMCETCTHRMGDIFQDPEDKKITRTFCRARYTNVNVEEMTRYCDFYTLKAKTNDK